MVDRVELDRHYLVFPESGPPVWRILRSEENLAEERLAEEVRAVKVNRSERRAHVSPAPALPVPGGGPRRYTRAERHLLKLRQLLMFEEGVVDEKGRRRGSNC